MTRQKWKGWITMHRAGSGPLARSPDYEFTCSGTAASTSVAREELNRLWYEDGQPLEPRYDSRRDRDLESRVNLKPIK